MREQEFRAWLQAQGYAPSSIATYLSDGRKADSAYDLDAQFDGGSSETTLAEMAYSRADEANGAPNPSRVELAEKLYSNLAGCRSAAKLYFRFRETEAASQQPFAQLSREDVFDAIAACDAAGTPGRYVAELGLGMPSKYWLIFDGKRYPSKAIVRDALRRGGSDWEPGGGVCKEALEQLDFVVVDWPELTRARDLFLKEMGDFSDFQSKEGPYWDIEREYKNELIEKARSTVMETKDDRAVGERIYRSLAGAQAGSPLGWRTLSVVQNSDATLRDRFYSALGTLARSDAPLEEAIGSAARELEALREAGIEMLRRGEVLSIPIAIWATLHPDQASWFKIAKMDEMGQRFFGRRLFRSDRFREEDLAEWLQLMRTLFGVLDTEFGWAPQDLFDVQGFIWVVGNSQPESNGELDSVPVWMVKSLWGEEDGLSRFIERREWGLLADTGSANTYRVREMQVGDRIFLKDYIPRARDLPFDAGGGNVTAHRFRAEGTITRMSEDGKSVGVDWQAWDEPRIWYFYTNNDAVWRLRDPGEKETADCLRRFLLEGEEQDIDWFLDAGWREGLFGSAAPTEETKVQPTNLILYGPPGTGKTYRTAREAVRLCGADVPENREALMQRYEELSRQGRIRFVTFHQSFSYEEFVEGLRPETASSEGDETAGAGFRLEPRAGIFRELCTVANEASKRPVNSGSFDFAGRSFWKMGLGVIGTQDSVYETCIQDGYVALGWGLDFDWSDPRFNSMKAIREEFESAPRENEQASNVTQLHHFRNTMKVGDIVIAPYGNKAFRAVGEVMGNYYFQKEGEPTYYHRRSVRWLAVLEEPLPLDTVIEGDFTQRTFYSIAPGRVNKEALARLVSRNESDDQASNNDGGTEQFVLIIDEINRANISKVFGELITLIEPDKRLGKPNALKVRLPYSKREFGVPANLHIIGTMNTADRSIALLDTALRRRFRFEEMAPDTSVAAFKQAERDTGLALAKVLDTMNERIEYLVDRDHRIGHAFFIGCKTKAQVDAVMRDKVIPLLQEYFFEDWNRLAAVLGEKDKGGNFLECKTIPDPMGEGGESLKSWRVRDSFDEGAYSRLVEGKPSGPVAVEAAS